MIDILNLEEQKDDQSCGFYVISAAMTFAEKRGGMMSGNYSKYSVDRTERIRACCARRYVDAVLSVASSLGDGGKAVRDLDVYAYLSDLLIGDSDQLRSNLLGKVVLSLSSDSDAVLLGYAGEDDVDRPTRDERRARECRRDEKDGDDIAASREGSRAITGVRFGVTPTALPLGGGEVVREKSTSTGISKEIGMPSRLRRREMSGKFAGEESRPHNFFPTTVLLHLDEEGAHLFRRTAKKAHVDRQQFAVDEEGTRVGYSGRASDSVCGKIAVNSERTASGVLYLTGTSMWENRAASNHADVEAMVCVCVSGTECGHSLLL